MRISIVIPTRERCKYLRQSVRTALEIDDDDLEIVVSDNASSDGTKEMMLQVDDPRLVYVNTGARLSMRQNFEFALQNSTGEYVIFFGDDDGILTKQFRFLRQVLEAEQPDVLTWPVSTYGWKVEGYGGKTGIIRVRKNNVFGGVRELDADQCKTDLLSCNLKRMIPYPAVYHGCASRRYMEQTSLEDGSYFNGSIPDFYFSYLSILKGGRFAHVDHPFTISGHSPASTGGSQSAKSEGNKNENPGIRFGEEIQKDDIKDVMGYALSVQLALFSSVETARYRFPSIAGELDYKAWYGYVLNSAVDRDESIADSIRNVLQAYAEKTETVDQLKLARPGEVKSHRTMKARWEKAVGTLTSRRVDAGDTIYSAVTTLDKLLGQDYSRILNDEVTRTEAWKLVKLRSKASASH